MNQQSNNETTFGLIAYPLKDTLSAYGSVSRGVCTTEKNMLVSITERTKIAQTNSGIIDQESNTKLTGDEPASMNFWVCTPKIFDEIEAQFLQFLAQTENIEKGEIYLPFVIQEMLADKKIKVEVQRTNATWFGVTYAQDKINAVDTLAKMTSNQAYSSPLWKK